MHFADVWGAACRPSLGDLEQHDRLWFVHFQEDHRVDVEPDQHQSRVTNHKSAPAARFWVAMARDSRWPSGRLVVIMAISMFSTRP